MRYIWRLVIIICLYFFSLGVVHATFSLEIVELVDNLDIKAIKSINLTQTNEVIRATVVVQFSTSAPIALKLRNADFSIIFRDRKNQEIYLGTTQAEELFFPASQDGSEKLVEESLDVFVGKNDEGTIRNLIELFNLIGTPDTEFTMILSGKTEVGTKTRRGWLYQGKIEIEDFTFYPTIQREVLFK